MIRHLNTMIENQHPIIVDIRWYFHNWMLRTYKDEKQWGHDRWLEHIKTYKITVQDVVKRYLFNKEFRHDVNRFLEDQCQFKMGNRIESLGIMYPDAEHFLDVTVYENFTEDDWAQGMFCVNLHDDVYWTNSPRRAADAIKQSLRQLRMEIMKKKGWAVNE